MSLGRGDARTAGAPPIVPPEYAPLLRRLQAGGPPDAERPALVEAALAIWRRPGLDTLTSVSQLHFTPFPHQLAAAAAVLTRLRGRAILADEVGLGKTIEAGLVLTELMQRRLARRSLILVPSGLAGQWHEELTRKFGLPALSPGTRQWQAATAPWDQPVLILPLPLARRAPWRDEVARREWDLVICDEAHRLRDPATASAKLVKGLRTRYLLLLTATPLQNGLDDVFHLAAVVRPGALGTHSEFRRRYGRAGDPASARDLADLQRRLQGVMVRHRRSEVALMLPRRLAETLVIEPTAREADLYAAVSDRVRQEARHATGLQAAALLTLQRQAGSGPAALAAGLRPRGWDDLRSRALALGECAKAEALLALLRRHRAADEKVIVFTAFRETLGDLQARLLNAGLPAAVYHGGLSRTAKDATIAAFERELPILLTTEAAGEGRNLQFCHAMISYDLPWNPMQIEQRLGRIHRIGQARDVVLHNLVVAGTIEARILAMLESKINLFELVVGELDMILGRVADDFDFETSVFAAHTDSTGDADFEARLQAIGARLAGARADYAEGRARVDGLVPAREPA